MTQCVDGSDEFSCQNWTCTENWQKCYNGLQCIRKDRFCDGSRDCFDYSDEQATYCAAHTCLPGYTKCADNLQCISKNKICDGTYHCKDISDELCEAQCLKTTLQPDEKDIIKKCQEDTDICFPITQFCDGQADCPEGSDEAQSGCTCEDWDLISYQQDNVKMCMYPEWTSRQILNQSVDLTNQTNNIKTGIWGKSRKRGLRPPHRVLTNGGQIQIRIWI